MLPFIVALVFAVGLPLLPPSLHRALHLPTLKFNFLSARRAPEQLLVSSPEPTLLLESSYSEASPDTGGSPQYLVFPDIPAPDCWNDAAAVPTCMSLTEKQDYPQTSIWNIIHAQLLYQFAEATVIITLSFFAAATFFPRHCLRTFLERLSTSLFISRHYNSKAALSSFLQDVFSGLHRYWMENSVAKGQALKSAPDTSWLAALEVFADVAPGECCNRDAFSPSVFISVRQDHPRLVPLDKANLSLGSSSSSVSSISQVQSTKISPFIDTTYTPLLDVLAHSSRRKLDISRQERPPYILGTIITRDPSHATPHVIIETTSHDSDITDAEKSFHLGQLHHLEAPEPSSSTSSPVSSHLHSSTESLPSISMEDLYNSARRGAAAALLSESFRGVQEAIASDPSAHSYSSCDHESLLNVAGTTPDPKSERFLPESNSSSSLTISEDGHRRYKSDSIQVRAASCHLGDTVAPLAPAKVDATCAFWKCAPQNGEGGLEIVVKEASGSGSLPGCRKTPHIQENKLELADGSPIPIDAAVTGIAITPEGMLVVPASQRSDGREIRFRVGQALREPLAEKYRPPEARRRTSTWDPHLLEHTGSPSSSPHLHDSPLPLTPKDMRHQLFVRHNPTASLSDNGRQSNVEGASSTTALTLPSIKAELSPVVVEAHERKSPPKTSFSGSVISTSPVRTMFARTSVPVSNLVTPSLFADRLLSRSAALGLSPTKNATENIKEVVEASQANNSVDRDCQADLQPEERSSTHCALTDAKGAGRRPLQDITASISVPRLKTIEYQVHLLPATTAGPTPATLKQVTDVSPKEVFEMPIPISEEVLQPSGIPTLHHRRPRARRSAPHLGQHIHNINNGTKQQAKPARAVQMPDGLKRRRTRTASARGVENWDFNISWATPMVDRNGQIILPAGTGWKGHSSAGTAGQQQQQRQTQPTTVIV